MNYEADRYFNEVSGPLSLWADSGLLITDPDLLFYIDGFKTAFKRSGTSSRHFQKTFKEYKIQISLFLESMNQSSTSKYTKVSLLYAKVSLLHTKVSLLYAKVSDLHTKVSHLHTKVSDLHAKVPYLYTKVSYLSGVVLNFFKISTSKMTSMFLGRA